MLSDKKLSPENVFHIADAMQAATAGALLRRRSTKGRLSDAEYQALIEKETALRHDADRWRAVGITLLATNGALTAQSIVDTIDDAGLAIQTVGDLNRALNIMAGLVTLGLTLSCGHAEAILNQMAALRATVKANT